jgi:hypothetical protein
MYNYLPSWFLWYNIYYWSTKILKIMKQIIVSIIAVLILASCSTTKKSSSNSGFPKDFKASELAEKIDGEFAALDAEAIPGVVRARLSDTKLSNDEIVDSVYKAVTQGRLDTIPYMVWLEYENFINEHIEDSKYQVYLFTLPNIDQEIQYLRAKREKKEKKNLKKVKANEKVVSIVTKDFALDLAKDLKKISSEMKTQFKTETSSRLTVNGFQALKAKIIESAKKKLDFNINAYKQMLKRRIEKMF